MTKDLDKITIKRGKRGDFSPTQSDHYHNHYEFCYLNSGKCRFLLQDSVYQLEKGDLVFITPGDLHHAIYTSNPTCEIIMICFRREDIDWAMLHRIMENRESSPTLHSFMGSIPLLYQEEFVQLLLRMLSEATIIDDYSNGFYGLLSSGSPSDADAPFRHERGGPGFLKFQRCRYPHCHKIYL